MLALILTMWIPCSGDAQEITNGDGPTNITANSASLTGELVSTGGEDASTAVIVTWGTLEHSSPDAWANQNTYPAPQSPTKRTL